MDATTTDPIRSALDGAFAAHGGRRALVSGTDAYSYRDLRGYVLAAARLLGSAWPDGPRRVGFHLANSADYVIFYFGTLYAGHLPFLLDAHFNAAELETIQQDCGLDACVIEAAKAADFPLPAEEVRPLTEATLLSKLSHGEPPHAPRPDTRVLRFTSGTTGRVKCLEFSGAAVAAAARNWVAGTGLGARDRILCLAALSNGLAFNTSLLSAFLAGAELHLYRGTLLTRTVARLVRGNAITRLVAFPTLYRLLVEPGGPEGEAMASLDHAISAGAPLWSDVRAAFRDRYGLDVSDYYGIAETGPCTFERGGRATGLGEPLPGVELKIDADAGGTGEVLVKSESMTSGYLNHPGVFEARLDGDGFFRSGDVGRLEDGRLHLTGRTGVRINVGGREIDPAEVTQVVLGLGEVVDAVVFADRTRHRETVMHLAVVAAAPGLTREALVAACRSRLAAYKIPSRISIVEEIPRNGIGKPRIALIREALAKKNSPTVDERTVMS